MQPVSDTYASVYAENHDTVARVDVFYPDGSLAASTEDGRADIDLVVTDGEVRADASQQIRRSLSLTLLDPTHTLVPAQAWDLFSIVSGNEISPWVGVRSRDGNDELFQQGVFVITGSNVEGTAAGVKISLTGSDRLLKAQERSFVRPYTVANNMNVIAAIQALLRDRIPDLEFRVNTTTTHTTVWHVLDEQANPLQDVGKMADSIGVVIYMDVDGVCVIDDVSDPVWDEPTWSYAEGEDSTLVSVGPKASRSDVKNGQIVTGDSIYGITPARGEYWDTDPSSPTYVGVYGYVPEFTSDPNVRTKQQAIDAAKGLFLRKRGFSRAVKFSIVANPAQTEDDVVRINHSDTRVADTFVVQGFTVPFTSGQQEITTRARQVTT